MEFTHLRVALRRLIVLSQMHCEELDNARLNILAEIQRSNQSQVSVHDLVPGRTYYSYNYSEKSYEPFVCEKQYTSKDPEWDKLARTRIVSVPPQSVIVVGGGPTGLITVIHCCENTLISGGVMKLYEARDAFAKGGSTFERAQIVRLDARWIAMLRYVSECGSILSQMYTFPHGSFLSILELDSRMYLFLRQAKPIVSSATRYQLKVLSSSRSRTWRTCCMLSFPRCGPKV